MTKSSAKRRLGLGSADPVHKRKYHREVPLSNIATDISTSPEKSRKATHNRYHIVPSPDTNSKTKENQDSLFFSRNTTTYINLLETNPPAYLKNYRNPCWKQKMPSNSPYQDNLLRTSDKMKEGIEELERLWMKAKLDGQSEYLRCLPYFYVAGFAKCGTSDLFSKIKQHPDVANTLRKEIRWWTNLRFKMTVDGHTARIPISMYADLFDGSAREVEEANNTDAYHQKVFGEATPNTLMMPADWRDLPENTGFPTPHYFNPQYIHHVTPQARILIIVRNPIERLFSSYRYFNCHRGLPCSGEDFHARVEETLAVWQDCLTTASSDWDCIANDTVRRRMPLGGFRDGLYAVYIAPCLQVFPRDQVLLLRLEDYAKERPAILRKVFNFLNLRALSDGEISRMDQTRSNSGSINKLEQIGPMLNKTRRLLEKAYHPYNQALAKLAWDRKFDYS